MARNLPVLLGQVESRYPDEAPEQLRAELFEWLEDFPSSRLVAYPEFHTVRVNGGPQQRREEYEQCAEPLDGPRVTALRDIGREAGVWLLPGTVIERGDDGEMYNTALAIGPDGEFFSYRKIFPWRPFEPFKPGHELVTFDIPDIGRVGLAVCYDIWYPEVIRNLAYLGAELIVVPTQTSTIDREQELILARATAIQNQVFVAAVNAAEPAGTGRSIIVDPEGLVRVQTPSESAAVVTDVIDFDAVSRVREYGTCGLNRLWSQSRPGDPSIALPMYGGQLEPNALGAAPALD